MTEDGQGSMQPRRLQLLLTLSTASPQLTHLPRHLLVRQPISTSGRRLSRESWVRQMVKAFKATVVVGTEQKHNAHAFKTMAKGELNLLASPVVRGRRQTLLTGRFLVAFARKLGRTIYDPDQGVQGTVYAGSQGKDFVVRLAAFTFPWLSGSLIQPPPPKASSPSIFSPRGPGCKCRPARVFSSFQRFTDVFANTAASHMYCWQLGLSHGTTQPLRWVDIDAAVTQSRAPQSQSHLPLSHQRPSAPPSRGRGPCSLAGDDEMDICLVGLDASQRRGNSTPSRGGIPYYYILGSCVRREELERSK